MPSDNDYVEGGELFVCTCLNDCPSLCCGLGCGCLACHKSFKRYITNQPLSGSDAEV